MSSNKYPNFLPTLTQLYNTLELNRQRERNREKQKQLSHISKFKLLPFSKSCYNGIGIPVVNVRSVAIIGDAVAGDSGLVHNAADVVAAQVDKVVGPRGAIHCGRARVGCRHGVRVRCSRLHALLLLLVLWLHHLNNTEVPLLVDPCFGFWGLGFNQSGLRHLRCS